MSRTRSALVRKKSRSARGSLRARARYRSEAAVATSLTMPSTDVSWNSQRSLPREPPRVTHRDARGGGAGAG